MGLCQTTLEERRRSRIMFKVEEPYRNKDRQRFFIWWGDSELYETVCKTLEQRGYDLKNPFPTDRAVCRFVWLPRNNPDNLKLTQIEEIVREVVDSKTGDASLPKKDRAQIQEWLERLHTWASDFRPQKQTAPLLTFFEIEQLIVREEYGRAEQALQQHFLRFGSDSEKHSDILRAQMFLKHSQGHTKSIWELYDEWQNHIGKSLDAPMAYWVGLAAFEVGEYAISTKLLNEIRKESLDQFYPEEKLEIWMTLVQLMTINEEWLEALLTCGQIFRPNLELNQKDILEEIVLDAYDELKDTEDLNQYLIPLPEELQEIIKDEFDLEDIKESVHIEEVSGESTVDEVEQVLSDWELYYKENPASQIQELKRCGNDHPRIRLAIARTYLEGSNKPLQAKSQLQEVNLESIINEKEQLAYHKVMLMGYLEEGNIDKAVKWSRDYMDLEGQKVDPKIASIYGQLKVKQGETDEALEYLDIAIEQGINDWKTYLAAGKALIEENQGKSSDYLQKALKLNPTCREALEWLPYVEGDKRIVFSALQAFFKSLESGLWIPKWRDMYAERVNAAKAIYENGGSSEQENDLAEAYMDLIEFFIRQDTVPENDLEDLLNNVFDTLQNGQLCLDIMSTLEILPSSQLVELSKNLYFNLIYNRLLYKEEELKLVKKATRQMVMLGVDSEIIADIESEVEQKLDQLTDEKLEDDIATDYQELLSNLSNIRVVLIGGYENVRKRVGLILSEDYKIDKFKDIAPAFENRTSTTQMKEAVNNVDVILFMDKVCKHVDYYALKSAMDDSDKEKLVYVPGKGHSSVINAFENYIIENN